MRPSRHEYVSRIAVQIRKNRNTLFFKGLTGYDPGRNANQIRAGGSIFSNFKERPFGSGIPTISRSELAFQFNPSSNSYLATHRS